MLPQRNVRRQTALVCTKGCLAAGIEVLHGYVAVGALIGAVLPSREDSTGTIREHCRIQAGICRI